MDSDDFDGTENAPSEGITIDAFFPDGTRMDMNIKDGASVNDLISEIEASDVKIPAGKEVAVIYYGHILEREALLSDIEPSKRFAVQIYFKSTSLPADLGESGEELYGFDRLKRMGYSEAQIQEIRTVFHQQQGTSDYAHAYQIDLEEEWFPSIFNQDNPLGLLRIEHEDLINLTDDIAIPEIYEEREAPSWVGFSIGLIIGLILGAGSFILVAAFLDNRPFVFGATIGAIIQIFAVISFGFGL